MARGSRANARVAPAGLRLLTSCWRSVSTEVYEGIPDAEEHAALDTLTLIEVDGRTTLTVLVEHPTKEGRDAHIDSGMEAGMQDAMDLLEQVAISLR